MEEQELIALYQEMVTLHERLSNSLEQLDRMMVKIERILSDMTDRQDLDNPSQQHKLKGEQPE